MTYSAVFATECCTHTLRQRSGKGYIGSIFCGAMNPAFRQIGNAVPPLMAKALATDLNPQPARKDGARTSTMG